MRKTYSDFNDSPTDDLLTNNNPLPTKGYAVGPGIPNTIKNLRM